MPSSAQPPNPPTPRPAKPDLDAMETVRRNSSLPSGVFKKVDDTVEQALTGPVADVFLAHMMAPQTSKQERARRLEPIKENQVEPAEIIAFYERYASADRVPAPDVTLGLDTERMWVLADLATHGSGRARELATRELKVFVRRMSSSDFSDLDVLRALIQAVERRSDQTQITVLLQVLLASAREALRQIERGAG